MRKMSKEEKIELKYGNPVLKHIAGDNSTAIAYYDMYLDAQRQIRADTIETYIAYAISMTFTILSLWQPLTLITAFMFLVLAVQAGINVRIERIWAAHFTSDLITCVNQTEYDERLSKLEGKNDGR